MTDFKLMTWTVFKKNDVPMDDVKFAQDKKPNITATDVIFIL